MSERTDKDVAARFRDWFSRQMATRDLAKLDLARKLGVSHSTVGRWMEGEDIPGPKNCRKLAAEFGYSPNMVMALAGHVPQTDEEKETLERQSALEIVRKLLEPYGTMFQQAGRTLDLRGSVPAGYPEIMEAAVEEKIEIPASWFGLRVSGDSMVELGIENGDLVFIDPTVQIPRRNSIVVAQLSDGTATIKRWIPMGDHVRLEPANHKYQALDARDVRVLGVIAWHIRDMRR